MYYVSTRDINDKVSPSYALIKGICDNGGLYVPDDFYDLSNEIQNLLHFNYSEMAEFILSKFLSDFTKEELNLCIYNSYNLKFSKNTVAPITKVYEDYFLELYHGPTLAFKDIALTIMPHLLETALNKANLNKKIIILTATSGDTGKAALEGFKNLNNFHIIVFFPEEGVSSIQKLQMRTQDGNNNFVVGINGNFDDAQGGVKSIFNNKQLQSQLYESGYLLSSANSINIGRLLPQIIYYFYTYISLVNSKEINLYDKINFVVPTGNFGNILAGYYAKLMGLPINKLICASNDNNVLYDFFTTGIYDKNRELKLTSSPSMDILISSNLERLLFEICNRDSKVLCELVKDLNEKGSYNIDAFMMENLKDFDSYYTTCEEVSKTIHEVFHKYNYLIDTHTAVAYQALKKYKNNTKDTNKSVIVSTASPYKFSKDVLDSLGDNLIYDEFGAIKKLSEVSNTKIPTSIIELINKEIIHKEVFTKDKLQEALQLYLKRLEE